MDGWMVVVVVAVEVFIVVVFLGALVVSWGASWGGLEGLLGALGSEIIAQGE